MCDTTSMERKNGFFRLHVDKLGTVTGLYSNNDEGKCIPIEVENDSVMPELAIAVAEVLCAEMLPRPEHISLVGYTPMLVQAVAELNPIFDNVSEYPWVATDHNQYAKCVENGKKYGISENPILVVPHCLGGGVKLYAESKSKLSIIFLVDIIPYEPEPMILLMIKKLREKGSFAAWWIHEWSPSLNRLALAIVIQQETLPAQVIHRRQTFPKFFRDFERQLKEACRG